MLNISTPIAPLLMHVLSYASSDLAYFEFAFHFIVVSAATVLYGVKVRFCESLGCGRGHSHGHLLMRGGRCIKNPLICVGVINEL